MAHYFWNEKEKSTMDRFTEETISNLPHMRKIWGEEPSPAVLNVCENCGQSCDRLTLVPEFEYMGCDQCMEEALAVIAREQLDPETGCSAGEIAADLPSHLRNLAITMSRALAAESN